MTTPAHAAPPGSEPTVISNLSYGPANPGNLLDLHLPDVPGKAALPLVIWHSGSAWFSNDVKTGDGALDVAQEFTSRGYAVATINVRSSVDARFPAQGHDVRAAVRYLREHAAEYGIDPNRFGFMGNSSGGWSAAFAATTSDMRQLPGEMGVDGTSSAVQVAVPFFPPTDFLSMDTFAAENGLPMAPGIYPHDAPTSPESRLIDCPGEVFPTDLVSIQACPAETEAADPSSYIEGTEIPVWVLHGLSDPLLPYNQSRLVYETTTAAGNEARFTLVPGAGHSVDDIIGAATSTTWSTHRGGHESVVEGAAPTWDDIEQFLHENLSRARGNGR
ncbi:alpha/beta fold hydrolase [Geodermatophilus sp. SYSU D00758]